jgi:CRP-like cAMP-binding protein/glyoxylase-like metal-dependent hydrolase (beta-lactamase superfamily II)
MLTGIWLTAESVHDIDHLLLELLTPNLPDPGLRAAGLEELRRGVKLASVVLESLGLRSVGIDADGAIPLQLVTPKSPRDPWREALTVSGGDRPIGFLIGTADAGTVAFVHEVFTRFGDAQKDLVRRYTAFAALGTPHQQTIAMLAQDPGFVETLNLARRHVQYLDPAILFSADGTTRVQLGSVSQTTKDILREGLQGTQIFVLPTTLYEGKINYGDVEFLVYLNFFLRQKMRTLIVGTSQQRDILHRLLTVTVFGLFDPSDEPPSFEELRETYGVTSHDTYGFLRAAYEIYGVRKDSTPDSPLLGIDDYVDFVTLEADETVIPVPGAEVRVRPAGRAVDVRIVQRDGRETEKRLELAPPRRTTLSVPEEFRRALQFATDRPRFGVTPLGTSHGFDHAGDFTCFIVWVNGKGILVDPSPEALIYLDQIGVAEEDVPYVFLTHVHSDHDGGLIAKLISGSRTAVIASDPVFRAFTEKAQLLTGHDFEGEGLVAHIPANPGTGVEIEIAGDVVRFETRWNLHPIPTNGFKLSFDGKVFGYSGDTQYDPALLRRLRDEGKLTGGHYDDLMYFFWTPDGVPTVDVLYHEAGIPPVHTDKRMLHALPEAVTGRMYLVHIADSDVPDGFVPPKPQPFRTLALQPPTLQFREHALLEPMRLVAYLYDVPSETLETLLHGGEVVAHPAGSVILRKGPVGKNEPLYFHIVTDGQVSVRDGTRIIATLTKSDSFGEWGISHQRGFRVADVVADRPSQTIRLSEAQYRWLVGRHPVIQERLGQIRRLLPRLQMSQELARLKAQAGLEVRSVIENMTASQLASLALFGTVQTFKHGDPVILRGDEADGFYILLSGHLAVSVDDGPPASELGEGDVFGERGLLEGGKRAATVSVASADAEVLFMSALAFQTLLQTVPAFAWGIWETAGPREFLRRPRRQLTQTDEGNRRRDGSGNRTWSGSELPRI